MTIILLKRFTKVRVFKKRIYLFNVAVMYIIIVMFLFLNSCSYNSVEQSQKLLQKYKEQGVAVESEICMVKNDYKGIVTVISDDGYIESGLILNDLAKELDINATVAGVVNIISPKAKKWQSIEKEGHLDIVNHSYTHLKVSNEKKLTKEQVRHEYVDAKEYYKNNFKTPSFTIVAPENSTTEEGFSIWQEMGILAARLGARGENALNKKITYGTAPGEWLNLKMRGLYDAKDTIGRNAWIDSAINNGTWVIEMWHDISPNGDVRFQPISTAKAREHLEYISKQQEANNIWAASFTQAVSYIYQRDYGEVKAYMMNNSIAVCYNKLKNDLPWDEFNVPITVKIAKSDITSVKKVYSAEMDIDYTIEDGYIYFDMPTDGTVVFIKI